MFSAGFTAMLSVAFAVCCGELESAA